MSTFTGVNRGRIGLWMLIALLAAAGAQPVEAQTKLRWKFKPGEKIHYETVMDLSQEMTIKDMPFKSKMVQTMDVLWEPQSVKKDGSAVINQTFERVQVEMTSPIPGQAPVKFDSAAAKQEPGAEPFAKIFGSLTGHPTSITVSPLGEVSDIKIAPELLEMAQNAGPAGAGMMSEQTIKEMISRSMFQFPAELKPNQSWESNIETPNPVIGKQSVSTTYTYLGPAEHEGHKVEKIGVNVVIKFEPGPDAQAKVTIKDQSGEGTILFDNEQGVPLQTQINSKMTTTIEAGGQSLEQVVNTNVQMRQKPTDKE
jgi:hypothetical protein